MQKEIIRLYIKSSDQLGDIFTKLLARSVFNNLCFKLDIFYFYALA